MSQHIPIAIDFCFELRSLQELDIALRKSLQELAEGSFAEDLTDSPEQKEPKRVRMFQRCPQNEKVFSICLKKIEGSLKTVKFKSL